MSTDSDSTVTDDFFRGDIRASLERVRKRLLDLTNRNRLLNFRYPKRTRSILRIVDELPDQLAQSLLSGEELLFDPVRKPTRRELEEWRHERMQKLREEYGENLDEELDRRAEAIAEPTVEEFARRLGVRTDYELPRESEDVATEPRHTDSLIQTLLFPDDLERVLTSLRRSAQLAIQETGSNMLYLALGFLEWYESESSDIHHLAPLFLLPLELTKKEFDHDASVYRYAISYSGEDLIANVSLQEKLRQDFSLVMPDLEEDELPERCWSEIEKVVERRPRWRVRHHATLCLLSFGKLLMYRDLDPDRWPGDGLEGNQRIRDFFVGVGSHETGAAQEYRLDEMDKVPGLIDNADSSQHSALVDVANGDNVVIEGPPGTGKSQTITNLIAAALEEGKKVLFVSEKLAALEVVQKRLDDAGLGLFCLELHSHKTRKKEFLKDIEERLERCGSFQEPGNYLQIERQLLDCREQLNRYATLIQQKYGCIDKTVHEILWAAKLRSRRLGPLVDVVKDTSEACAPAIDHIAMSSESRALSGFGDALQPIIYEYGGVSAHPWFGVTNSDLTFVDRSRVVAAVGRAGVKARAVDLTYGATPAELDQFITAIRGLPTLPDQVPATSLKGLRSADGRAAARKALADLRSLASARESVAADAAAALVDPGMWNERLKKCVDALSGLLDASATLAHGRTVIEQLPDSIKVLERGAELLTTLEGQLPALSNGSVSVLRAACALRDALGSIPIGDLALRTEVGSDVSKLPVVDKLRTQQEQLIKSRDKLNAKYSLDVLPSASQLKSDAMTLASAGLFGWLQSEVRAASRRLRAITRVPQRLPRIEMADELRSLARFVEQKTDFEKHPALKELAGTFIDGLATPLSGIDAVLQWQKRANISLQSHGSIGDTILELLDAMDPVALEALADRAQGHADTAEVNDALESVSGLLDRGSDPEDRVADLVISMSELRDKGQMALEWLSDLGAGESWTFDDLKALSVRTNSLTQIMDKVEANSSVGSILLDVWKGAETDPELVEEALAYAEIVIDACVPERLVHDLLSPRCEEQLEELLRHCDLVSERLGEYREDLGTLVGLTALDLTVVGADGAKIENAEIENVAGWCEQVLRSDSAFESWVSFQNSLRVLKYDASREIAELGTNLALPPDRLADAFEYVLYESLAREAFSEHPDLVQFKGMDHDRLRDEYVRVDEELIRAYRHRVAASLDKNFIPSGNGVGPVRTYTDLALIEREVEKQKRHIPIRQLVKRASGALQALKPCFMMGPLSVAQYLEPGNAAFDLIVMDEASQIKPEDALGAVARGAQLVVVGDPKQLPPTSFFDRLDETDGDEEDGLAEGVLEAESILDVAAMAYRPTRTLRWHYRSRHQSLVDFSNQEFYNKKLIIYPSSTIQHDKLGVKFHPVRGRYEGRKNVPEAAAVVDFVLKHMRTCADESLGVATMNTVQRDLIHDEFEQRAKSDPSAQAFLAEWENGLEPFFIKNLENVQGDERDVIVVSVTYGPDANGRIYQRFGPINGPTGHRRLNVLVTRAKNRVEVFSSMRGDDVKITEKSAPGAVILKNYLNYAEKGVLDQVRITGRDPDSDFEIEVAQALQADGHRVVAQVGVAGYFVDLAIRHPKTQGRFILGIECDGATYHSAKSARDRDRLRQQVLEDKGWTIHRIWSTDWFRDPSRETKRVVDLVQDILEREPPWEMEVFEGQEATAEPAAVAADAESELIHAVTSGSDVDKIDRISVQDGKEELVEFRQTLTEAFPDVPADHSLLRPVMLDVLLRALPRDRDQWLDKIPMAMRLETAPEHMVVLEDVMAILRRIVR